MNEETAKVKRRLLAELKGTIPPSIDPGRDFAFNRAALAVVETVMLQIQIRQTEHWVTIELGESGEGWAMWKASSEWYEMHEHAVDIDPIEVKPLRPGVEMRSPSD